MAHRTEKVSKGISNKWHIPLTVTSEAVNSLMNQLLTDCNEGD